MTEHSELPLTYHSPKEMDPSRQNGKEYTILTVSRGSFAQAENEAVAKLIVDSVNKVKRLEDLVDKYQERLEIKHCYNAKGDKVEIPEDERDSYPDAIDCRDETIKGLEGGTAPKKQTLDQYVEGRLSIDMATASELISVISDYLEQEK